MIKLVDVNKIYETGGIKTHALKNVNLEISKGDYISVVGTSGSGKSTLLNIIGCMDNVSSGEYIYDDVSVSSLNMKRLHEFRKEHVSFVFQNFALLNAYTVYENVELPLIARGIGNRKRKQVIEEILETVGLIELKDKLPVHISGGQQQRTAIARALVTDNNLILADEPTGALDQNTGKEVMELFAMLNQKGKTLIVVTHDINVASRAKRIIRIEDGIVTEEKNEN